MEFVSCTHFAGKLPFLKVEVSPQKFFPYLPDGHGRILPRSDSSVNNLVLSYYEMERDDNFVAGDLSVSYSMGLGR